MNTAVRAQNVPFLPPAWAAMLKRACLSTLGLAIAALGFAVAVALLTYTAGDPSLDTATRAGAQNALGLPGAIVADAMLQAAGLLWTARRAAGRAMQRLPLYPTWDTSGMRMELVR